MDVKNGRHILKNLMKLLNSRLPRFEMAWEVSVASYCNKSDFWDCAYLKQHSLMQVKSFPSSSRSIWFLIIAVKI